MSETPGDHFAGAGGKLLDSNRVAFGSIICHSFGELGSPISASVCDGKHGVANYLRAAQIGSGYGINDFFAGGFVDCHLSNFRRGCLRPVVVRI